MKPIARTICLFFVYFYSLTLWSQQPHIFIIYADDLGWGDLSIHGHPRIHTPHIDSFAMHSRQLRFYSGSPVCSPSRAGLLTGRTPQALGIVSTVQKDVLFDTLDNYEMRSVEQNMPQLMQSVGYSTIHSGKWHITRDYDNEIAAAMGFDYSDNITNSPAWAIFAQAKNFIDLSLVSNPNKPIFAYITPNEAHYPLIDKLPGQLDSFLYIYQYDTITTDAACHNGNEAAYKANVDSFGQNMKYYYGAVTSLDYAFGDFLAYLDEKGIRDSSIIIFSSDNGPDWTTQSWGSPGCTFSGLKRTNYEGGIHVPGFVQWAGRWDDGDTVSTPTSVFDLMPTFANIVGGTIDRPYKIDGEDVADIWDKVRFERTKPIYWFFSAGRSRKETEFNYPEPGGYMAQAAFIDQSGRYKIIAELECMPDVAGTVLPYIEFLKYASYSAMTNSVFMYDLQQDPGETINIAQTQPTIFADVWRQFLKMDRIVRNQTPWFACERKREQNFNPCTPAPQEAQNQSLINTNTANTAADEVEYKDEPEEDVAPEEIPMYMTIFPNPAMNLITITSNIPPKEVTMAQVISLQGKIVKQVPVFFNFVEVDISDIEPGYYIFSVVQKGGSMLSQRFVKQ